MVTLAFFRKVTVPYLSPSGNSVLEFMSIKVDDAPFCPPLSSPLVLSVFLYFAVKLQQ